MNIPQKYRAIEGKLIASCQAAEGDAFRDSESMARFARACLAGGAAGIRANGPADIQAIRRQTGVPIIGIDKRVMDDGGVLITPSFESAQLLVEAGADFIAMDVSARGQRYGALDRIAQIKTRLDVPVLADIATVAEALAAAAAGADFVLSTLRGYTAETAGVMEFQAEFIEELVLRSPVSVIAEGRIHNPEQARRAIEAGAFAVIVGTAITRPREIARSFAEAIEKQFSRREASRFVAGMDLGGTATKLGLVSASGSISNEKSVPTPASAGGRELLAHLKRTADTLLQLAKERGCFVSSLGIATAGWVNVKTGTVAYATENLPGWTGTQIAREMEEHVHLPVAVENDANALALAEKQFGAGRGLRDFICVTLGTGVGGGCFVDGRLNRGAHWFANAIGHINLVENGLPCTCGLNGCLEAYCNAAALLRYAGPGFANAGEVIQAAAEGNEAASFAVCTLGNYLARGLSILVQTLDPEAIIISGGLAQNNALLFDCVTDSLRNRISTWGQRGLAIVPSPLGYHGGVLGAAAIAMERTGA